MRSIFTSPENIDFIQFQPLIGSFPHYSCDFGPVSTGRENSVPEVDVKVMAFVEEVLKKSPKIQLEDLFEKAKGVSASIGKLSKRQFNARYPLQVKRRRSLAVRKKGGRPRKAPVPPSTKDQKKGSRTASDPRETVRQVFLQFATDITGAEERKELVKVLANVDRYVDRVLKGVA